ncbi:MAG: membrane lipoprotein lipid attachment site-containing protein [archaeon]
MKKIIALLVLLVFVSGCSSLDSVNSFFKNLPGIKMISPSGGGKAFIGGTKSVTVEILQPPEKGKVSKDIPLRVVVNVKNDGESDTEGMVCITGLNSDVFEGSDPCKCEEFSLYSRSRSQDEKSEGESKTIKFEEGTPIMGELVVNDFSITSIVRYDYKTYASVEACVAKDVFTSKDCKSRQDAKVSGVSSGPIQIGSVSQELLTTGDDEYTMSLFIEVSHNGEGRFYDPSMEKDACGDDSDKVNKRVNVKLYNAPGSVTCSPLVFKAKEEKGTATCTITGIEARNYKSLMNVELSYTYEVRESNNFEVV